MKDLNLFKKMQKDKTSIENDIYINHKTKNKNKDKDKDDNDMSL